MVDTIKFDIPLRLTMKDLRKIKWTSITERQSKGSVKCFYNIKENNFIGEPYIYYSFDKHERSKCWLRVEVSLPKFRHGTNFYELNDDEMIWTLNMLKVFLCKKMKISFNRLPDVDSWTIKKMHVCKNFNVGSNMQMYLSNASKKVLQKRKNTSYKASGNDNIQSVYWKAKSTTEKVYDKQAEIKENEKKHEDFKNLVPKSKGCLRYENELSSSDISNLHSKNTTSQILSSAVIKPLLNKNLKRLNLDFNIQSTELKRVLNLIESDSTINTRSKNSLIAFVTKMHTLGESQTKQSYSQAGFYKIKSSYDDFLLKNTTIVTQNLEQLSVNKFDFAKFN